MPAVLPLIDRCYIGTTAAPTGGEPRAVHSYATGAPVKCFVMKETPGESGNGSQVHMDAVRISFRRDAGVVASTRIQVYRRLRQALGTNEYYEVIGAPQQIRNRLIAVCKRTTARSAK